MEKVSKHDCNALIESKKLPVVFRKFAGVERMLTPHGTVSFRGYDEALKILEGMAEAEAAEKKAVEAAAETSRVLLNPASLPQEQRDAALVALMQS